MPKVRGLIAQSRHLKMPLCDLALLTKPLCSWFQAVCSGIRETQAVSKRGYFVPVTWCWYFRIFLHGKHILKEVCSYSKSSFLKGLEKGIHLSKDDEVVGKYDQQLSKLLCHGGKPKDLWKCKFDYCLTNVSSYYTFEIKKTQFMSTCCPHLSENQESRLKSALWLKVTTGIQNNLRKFFK